MDASNNYLYYVIQDRSGKIRGNVLGAEHNIHCKDKDLSLPIREAIKRVSRAVLEQPPGSKLIPSSSPHYISPPERVIKNAIEKIQLQPSSPRVDDDMEKQTSSLLSEIEKQTVPENYEKVSAAIQQLQSSKDKVVVLQAILANIDEFNKTNCEENINRMVQANEQCTIEPLEDIDLKALLLEASKTILENKIGLLSEIKKQTVPEHYDRIIDEIQQYQSDEDKLIFAQVILEILRNRESTSGPLKDTEVTALLSETSKRIEAAKKDVPSTESVPQVDTKTAERRQTIQKEIYQAWVTGNADKLAPLLDECHSLYTEPEEIDKIQASRDENIAKRIVDVILHPKQDGEESLFVMGDSHLLYSKRKNVIAHLQEHFDSDPRLSGWSIKQVKSGNIA
jgi:hypothetical protein